MARSLLAVALLVACTPVRLGAEGRAWLDDHASVIEEGIPLTGLDPLIDPEGAVLLAESHGVAANFDLEAIVVRDLVDRHALGGVAAERGPGYAGLIARAAMAGDEPELQRLFEAAAGTYAATEESIDLALDLGEVLGGPDRPAWTGADIEHLWFLGIEALDAMRCGEGPLLDRLAALADDIESGEASSEEARELVADLQVDPSGLCPPDEAAVVLDALAVRYATYEAWAEDRTREGDELRESWAVDAFFRLDAQLDGPLYGRWGAWHVTRAPNDRFVDPLALRLRNADLPLLSVAIAYLDCETFDRDTGATRAVVDPVGEALAPHALGPMTLFVLEGAGSPFAERPLLVEDGLGPTTERYQAVILLEGSPSASPL